MSVLPGEQRRPAIQEVFCLRSVILLQGAAKVSSRRQGLKNSVMREPSHHP
jgi:hypothetical protein